MDQVETKDKVIKVRVTNAQKILIESKAKECGLSMSSYLAKLGMNYDLNLACNTNLEREIVKAYGILGKYVGMLKIHLNKYELKDYTQREIMLELKKAQKAREEIREIIITAFRK